MVLSGKINEYIKNSMIRGRLACWQSGIVNVYISPITLEESSKEYYYSEIERAMTKWNNVLADCDINIRLVINNNPNNSDIIIHWTKVGRIYEGMCKYLSVVGNNIRKVSIEVGLENKYSPKQTTKESIFFVMMHEFGHALGLGHGVDVDDIMFVPHQKNISEPSENDLFVLKMIYANH